jgi:hypothetical protein
VQSNLRGPIGFVAEDAAAHAQDHRAVSPEQGSISDLKFWKRFFVDTDCQPVRLLLLICGREQNRALRAAKTAGGAVFYAQGDCPVVQADLR